MKKNCASVIRKLSSLGFAQQEIAELCGVTQQAVYAWTKGHKPSAKSSHILGNLKAAVENMVGPLNAVTKAVVIAEACMESGGVAGMLFNEVMLAQIKKQKLIK